VTIGQQDAPRWELHAPQPVSIGLAPRYYQTSHGVVAIVPQRLWEPYVPPTLEPTLTTFEHLPPSFLERRRRATLALRRAR
jgi:hypothetical protein